MNWSLKSSGDVKVRPGMNEVSNQPLRRSTSLLDSGSLGGNNTSLVAKVPMKAATPSARRLTATDAGLVVPDQPTWDPSKLLDSSQEPNSRSSVFRVGIIRPVTNRECAAVITNTGRSLLVPSSRGILRSGNHKSH